MTTWDFLKGLITLRWRRSDMGWGPWWSVHEQLWRMDRKWMCKVGWHFWAAPIKDYGEGMNWKCTRCRKDRGFAPEPLFRKVREEGQ